MFHKSSHNKENSFTRYLLSCAKIRGTYNVEQFYTNRIEVAYALEIAKKPGMRVNGLTESEEKKKKKKHFELEKQLNLGNSIVRLKRSKEKS